MERAERSSEKWPSWRGCWGFRTARDVGAPDSRMAFWKGGFERRWWPIWVVSFAHNIPSYPMNQ